MIKKLLIGVLILVVVMQFIPSNLPETSKNNSGDIFLNNSVPKEIETLIRNSCYNCHSNETTYPWYSHVAPVSFLVSNDVRKGRKHLNFSEWESLSKIKKAEALDDLTDEVGEGGMPLKIYLVTHPEADLSQNDREKITTWADEFADSIFED